MPYNEWNWKRTADSKFQIQARFQQDERTFSVSTIGAELPPIAFRSLRRTLRNGFARGIGPRSVIRLSTSAIRSVAAANQAVGNNLLGVYVPPCNLESGHKMVLAGSVGGAVPTYLDIRMPFDRGTQHGPHFVCGGAAITGVVAGSVDPQPGNAV